MSTPQQPPPPGPPPGPPQGPPQGPGHPGRWGGPPGPPGPPPPPPPWAQRQPVPPGRPKRTGLWIGLGAGALVLVLVIVTGVAVALSLGRDDRRSASGSGTAEETEGGSGGDEGSAAGDGAEGEDGQGGAGPGQDVASYTGPDTPTEVDVPSGPYSLPDDLCAGIGQETLDGLGISEEPTQSEAGGDDIANGSCVWHQMADDGSFQILRVRYQALGTERLAGLIYEGEAVEQAGILGNVVEEEDSDVGDESKVLFIDKGEGSYKGMIVIRLQDAVLDVEREIQPAPDGPADPTLEWGPTSELMPELGRQALNNLA